MTPVVFLVILCLGVASAAESSDPMVDAKEQEPEINNEELTDEEVRKGMWDEFMKKLEFYRKENSLENEDDVKIEMNAFDDLTNEEFTKMMNTILYPMFEEEEETQIPPVNDIAKLEDLPGNRDMTPGQDQPQ